MKLADENHESIARRGWAESLAAILPIAYAVVVLQGCSTSDSRPLLSFEDDPSLTKVDGFIVSASASRMVGTTLVEARSYHVEGKASGVVVIEVTMKNEPFPIRMRRHISTSYLPIAYQLAIGRLDPLRVEVSVSESGALEVEASRINLSRDGGKDV